MVSTTFRLAWRATRQLTYLGFAAGLTGCMSIADIDTSRGEPGCIRGCSDRYSSCVGVTFATSPTIQGCKEAFQICVRTCPPK